MPDYIFMLESRLAPEALRALNRMQQAAQEVPLNLYLVGGAVRDLMTGSAINDLDFVVESNPARLLRALQDSGLVSVEEDDKLKRADLVFEGSVWASVEMARLEFYRKPGEAPEVRAASILEDLRRRDFSVNAMGISLTPGSRGLLLDPTNGLADVETRQLRVLHNYSFVHDPLRLFRLVRYQSRLGFSPDERTRELFQAAMDKGYARLIRPQALRREWTGLAREDNSAASLKALEEQKLLTTVHRLLQKRKPDYDGLARLRRYRQRAWEAGYRVDPYRAAAHYILRRLARGLRRSILSRMGASRAEVASLAGLEKEGKRVVKLLGRRRHATPRRTFELLKSIPEELLVFVLAEFGRRKKVQSKVYNYLFKYRPLRARLPAEDLELLGIPRGPRFDEILEQYFFAQLDGKVRGHGSQVVRYLRKLAGLPRETKAKKEKRAEKVAALKARAAARAETAAEKRAQPAVPPPSAAAKPAPRKTARPEPEKAKRARRAMKPAKRKQLRRR